MHAIMVMFDSLRRDMLPCYNPDCKADLPNFARLGEHSVTFDKSYVCSMPCMPARREIHTGRANFLHRSWGPLEPFDDSMPELLKKAGVHAHLATDHYHYIQDGGATYHGRYSTWECYRGQESDQWIGDCSLPKEEFSPHLMNSPYMPDILKPIRRRSGWQNMANRSRMLKEEEFSQTLTFDNGIDFIRRNAEYDNWFVQIETFDPHEPFHAPDNFQSKWFDPDEPFEKDWPNYCPVAENEETISNIRKKYMALLEYCDKSLGRVLDVMDELDLWKDTLLIVNTDHGFFLGEHDW